MAAPALCPARRRRRGCTPSGSVGRATTGAAGHTGRGAMLAAAEDPHGSPPVSPVSRRRSAPATVPAMGLPRKTRGASDEVEIDDRRSTIEDARHRHSEGGPNEGYAVGEQGGGPLSESARQSPGAGPRPLLRCGGARSEEEPGASLDWLEGIELASRFLYRYIAS